MIQYGLISKVDADCLEKTLDLICSNNDNSIIYVTEVGCYGGETGKGVSEYIKSKQKIPFITGIDNNRNGEELRFEYDKFIEGNSAEVYNRLEDNSQDFVFIDACHIFPSVIADFFCYAPKVKIRGYIAFHDTGKHIKPMTGYQDIGSKDDPDMYISVRKAINSIGLLSPSAVNVESDFFGWELVFDEADENDKAGGICVFKKIYE